MCRGLSDIEARLRRAFDLMVVWWAWLVTPPVFGVALSPITPRIIPHFGRNASYFGRNESLVVGR